MAQKYKVFAYGSLMHQGSLGRTVPEAYNIFPARVQGLQRVFNLASHYRFDRQQNRPVCVLNVENAPATLTMNGICFDMDEQSIQALLHREQGYDFCPITAEHFDQQQVFSAYYFQAKQFTPYRYLPQSKDQQHYLTLCLEGCAAFGENFLADFKRSTHFWDIPDQQQSRIWRGEY